MNEEELERMQAHLLEQLKIAGAPEQHIEQPSLLLLCKYIYDTHQALGPNGYWAAYRAIDWMLKVGDEP